MTDVQIVIEDVLGRAPSRGDRLWVRATRTRSGAAGQVVAPVAVPIEVYDNPTIKMEPGPARVRFELRDLAVDQIREFPVTVPTEGPVTLRDILDEAYDWTPEELSAFAQLRADAIAAAKRAETAAEGVDVAIAGAAAHVVDRVEQDREAAETAAGAADRSARDAATSQQTAGEDADTADRRATAAGLSEAAAKISETNAATSEQAAADHALAADGSRTGAVEARDEARTARDQADGFRNEAGTHAATAADKATEAGTKATQAADFTTATRTYRDQAEAARDIAVANGLRWRGTWAAGTAYAAQDVVTHAGSSWRAVEASTGVEPAEGASWSLVAARGEPGQSGATEITWGDVIDPPTEFPPEEHNHGPETLGSGGTRSGTTFLNGLGNWVTPYTVMSSTEADEGTDTTPRVLSAARLRETIQKRVTGAAGTAVSLIGQALNRATTMAEARSVIGAVADDDERLSDARPPTAHPHTIEEVTGLEDALANAGSGDAADLTGTLTDQIDASAARVNGTAGSASLLEMLDALLYVSDQVQVVSELPEPIDPDKIYLVRA